MDVFRVGFYGYLGFLLTRKRMLAGEVNPFLLNVLFWHTP